MESRGKMRQASGTSLKGARSSIAKEGTLPCRVRNCGFCMRQPDMVLQGLFLNVGPLPKLVF